MSTRFFLLCFICIVCPISLLLTFNHVQNVENAKIKYIKSANNTAHQLQKRLDEKITNIINTAGSIFTTRWYEHCVNTEGIYDHEFNSLKKKEISSELRVKATALELVNDILVLVPSKNIIITGNDWLDVSEYVKVYKKVSILFDVKSKKYTVTNLSEGNYGIIKLTDINRSVNGATICILIDRTFLASYINQTQTEQLQYLEVSINGDILYTKGDYKDKLLIKTSKSGMPEINITTGFTEYRDLYAKENAVKLILQLTVLILVGIILSATLTALNIRPLGKLMHQFGSYEHYMPSEAYEYIGQYVKEMSTKNRQLNVENRSLNESIDQFINVMCTEMVFGMLTNPDFDYQSNMVKNIIPWIDENLPYMLVLAEPRSENFSNELSLPPDMGYHQKNFHIFGDEQCLFIWFSNAVVARSMAKKVEGYIRDSFENKFYISVSPILLEPEEMREYYLLLKNDITSQKQDELDLPILTQVEFITKIQDNCFYECCIIIDEVRGRYSPKAVFILLIKIAKEYGIDVSAIYDIYDKNKNGDLWSMLKSLTRDICQNINANKEGNQNETAKAIKEFIDDNYTDQNMSMKLLSDRFGLVGSIISKTFKDYTGITFSDYLLDLRIKKAIELLENPEISLTIITEAVGYTNYLTFKRAFMRHQGISPREYREQYYGGLV